MENLNFRLPAGGIVGVIGPNGAGKTTLFRMLTGQEKPDSGTLRVGETVELGYVDQSRDSLDPENTVFTEISGGTEMLEMGKRKMNSRAYVSRFNFRGTDQEKKVGDLSGGERNRVHLAKLLRRGSNVLLLDEPTNDLDVDTLRALEEAILSYAGCVVVTSHDRWFLDRVATHILAFEGDGYVHWCEGNFQTYEQQRRERMGISEDEPRRFRYKKMMVYSLAVKNPFGFVLISVQGLSSDDNFAKWFHRKIFCQFLQSVWWTGQAGESCGKENGREGCGEDSENESQTEVFEEKIVPSDWRF